MTCDRACGADLDLSLAVADGESMGAADPAFEAHVGVIHMWSLAVWEAWAPSKLLDTLVKGTISRLSKARSVWAVVRGPAAALVATVQRLGWTVGSATLLTDDKGRIIDLLKDSPAYVKGLAVDAVQRWRWSRIEKKLPWLAIGPRGAGAWWLPISRALRLTNSDGWGAAHKGALKSAIMDRQWTQQRLHAAHLADDSLCRLCLELPGGQQVGTLLHRTCCPALVDFNRQFMPECVKEVLAASGGEPGQLTRGCLTRGLFPNPVPAPRPMATFDTFHWHTEPRDVSAHVRVCTDGSLLHGQWGREYAALGWAFVAFDQGGEIIAAAYGIPPQWVDTIQGAELWAVQMVIASMPFPERLFTDCKTVQGGVRNTAQWAGSSKRRYARIWTVLRTGLDDGSEAHRVVWMPAHTARERIGEAKCGDGSVIDEHMWCANQMADLLAKQGAAAGAYPQSVISTMESQAKQATLVVVYLGRLTLEANQHVGLDGQKHADALKLDACVDRKRRLKKEVEHDTAAAKCVSRNTVAGSSHRRQARPPSRRGAAGGQVKLGHTSKSDRHAQVLHHCISEQRSWNSFVRTHDSSVRPAAPGGGGAARKMAELRERIKVKAACAGLRRVSYGQ